jgi:hypothetical protein
MGGLVRCRLRLRRRNFAALAVLVLVLAGCSSGSTVPSFPTPSFSSIFGSKSNATDGNASVASAPPADFECPGVTVRTGASTLSVSSNPAEQTALNLRYQVGIGTTARECRLDGTMVTMKVGVQGRVVLGPAGGPGQVNVPFRFAVVQEGVTPKTIVTKLVNISVAIPENDGNVLFSHVEDGLTFPMPRGGAIDYYVVYVGFDPLGAKQMERKRPAPRRPRPRRQS